MDPQQPTPKKVTHLENTEAVQTASGTLLVIGLVIGIFGFIGIAGYFFYVKTYSAKLADREDNALLYDDPNQKNILGAQITDLPQVQIGNNTAVNKQPTMTQQQQMMAMQQQAAQQQAAAGKQPGAATPDTRPPTPSATPTPADTYINTAIGFKVSNEGWTKQPPEKVDDITVTSYKNKDGSLILNITTTTKKYDSVQAYIDAKPRGRAAESSSDFSIGSEGGKKTAPYEVQANGTTYNSIAAYVKPRDGDGIVGIELDSTSLDVNDHSAEDTFKKITDTFTFIEKKTP